MRSDDRLLNLRDKSCVILQNWNYIESAKGALEQRKVQYEQFGRQQ
jgi:hypothetical protein